MNFFIRILLFGAFLLNGLTHAEAGPGVNNGGGGWKCAANGQNIWIQANDLWPWRASGQKAEDQRGKKAEQILAEKLRFIEKSVPSLQFFIERHPVNLKDAILFVDEDIEPVRDAVWYEKPPAKSCKGGFVSYVQVANFLSIGKLLVHRPTWESPEFGETDKAALLLHEIIYKAVRDEFSEETSARTANVVSLLFTRSKDSDINFEVRKALWSRDPSRRRTELVPLFAVNLRCEATREIFPEKAGAVKSERLIENDTFAPKIDRFQFHVRVDDRDGVPFQMEIRDLHSGTIATIPDKVARASFVYSKHAEVEMRLGEDGKLITAELKCWSEEH